jgi:hypothetical protein
VMMMSVFQFCLGALVHIRQNSVGVPTFAGTSLGLNV